MRRFTTLAFLLCAGLGAEQVRAQDADPLGPDSAYVDNPSPEHVRVIDLGARPGAEENRSRTLQRRQMIGVRDDRRSERRRFWWVAEEVLADVVIGLISWGMVR